MFVDQYLDVIRLYSPLPVLGPRFVFRLVVHEGSLYYICVMVHDYEIKLTQGNCFLKISEDPVPFIPVLEDWHLVSSFHIHFGHVHFLVLAFHGVSVQSC